VKSVDKGGRECDDSHNLSTGSRTPPRTTNWWLRLDEQRISVEVPSALLGFFLAMRLHGYEAEVVEDDHGWAVEVAADAPREWVLACVQRWVDDEALDRIVVHFGGSSYTMGRALTRR
jgi:hypothetical protein